MDQATHNKIVSFIWGIADDVLRDVFVRGKYRDVILPMCVLRRLDAVLEPTKKDMLETKAMLDQAKITEQRAALNDAAQQSFYNTSKFTLRVLKFNEESNEEAGEHWTPRDAVKLMANLFFLTVADQVKSGSYLLYDGACGTGGMLTVAEETLRQRANGQKKQIATHLYGQEIN